MFSLKLLFLVVASQGVQAQVRFVESGGDMRKPGDSLQLSCRGSGFSFGDHWLSWLRLSPGKGLEWVATISFWAGDTKRYAASVTGRFSISRSNGQNMLYLQMNNLKPEDSGIYFCTRTGGPSDAIFKGTKVSLIPRDQTTSEPSVSIMKSENESIAACLAKDFYPKELKILMNSDSEIIFEATDPILTSSGKYSAVKVVKLSSNELVSCSVQHNSKLINKTQTAEKPPDFTSPAPTIIASEPCNISTPSLEDLNEEKNTKTLSAALLGLEIVLAKSIVFNVLMIARLVFEVRKKERGRT